MTRRKGRACAAAICLSAIAVCLALTGMFVYPYISAAASDKPTMFVNNEPWYDEELYGWVKISSDIYVPITAFGKLEGVELKESKYLKNIMISYGGKYITIDTASKNIAYTEENGEFYMKTYLLRAGTLWVPAVTIANYFGFRFETNQSVTAIRLSDASGSRTLEDLLLQYNPALADPVVTTPPVTTRTDTVTTASQTTSKTAATEETVGSRLIYLTFEDALSDYLPQILDLLGKYNVKATFFLRGDRIVKYYDDVCRILAEGHAVGLHTMTCAESAYEKNFNVLLGELDEENNLLYKLFKLKTRLFRAPNGSSADSFFISAQRGEQLAGLGYVVWDWNVYVPDDIYKDAKKISDSAIAGIKKYSVPVLRFQCNKMTAESLPAVLDYIASNSQFTAVAITPASYEVNFVGLFR